jgi:hypothetical protein
MRLLHKLGHFELLGLLHGGFLSIQIRSEYLEKIKEISLGSINYLVREIQCNVAPILIIEALHFAIIN